jgi:hypothetical protein
MDDLKNKIKARLHDPRQPRMAMPILGSGRGEKFQR